MTENYGESKFHKYEFSNLDENCHKCLRTPIEFIDELIVREVGNQLYQFDVTAALKKTAGMPVVEIPLEMIHVFLTIGGVDEEHVDHVDTKHPGIMACFGDCVALVDGHHRATKCRRLRKPFMVYMFDSVASWLLVKQVERNIENER